ncbi:unnamed protein product [Adineta steineri]|uniref:WD repeat-containing protein n=1 Tax=Adineta steineri TaxID=433720 RepID=A0A818ZCT7_9BILA|nr:unnamed protein product [Adineta steineri]
MDQSTRRTVTFDDNLISNRPIHTSNLTFRLSNDQREKEIATIPHLQDTATNSDQTNITTQDLNNLLSGEEYIPGGFSNLDQELEEELMNDFDDDFDDQITRRSRYISSIRSSDPTINVTRSPIELWQRARILIAIHLYKLQNKIPNLHNDISMTVDSSLKKTTNSTDKSNYLGKLFEEKENTEERKMIFGLSILKQFLLDSSQQYQYIDFYDIEQGYIIMCNITVQPPNIAIDQKTNSKLLVYSMNKKLLNDSCTVEFDCPFQFNFMICIPIFRLILGFMNIKKQQSLMILIGDASRKSIFLSKQEISDTIYSILYIHEVSMLFIGCMGRVFLYNTQPLQFISQPLFISELTQLPFHSTEPIIHICQIGIYRSIGILSNRYFILWQYVPTEKLLLKFCNPYRYDFIRCHYISKYDYIVFAFIDGFVLIYQLNQMKQIRRYQYHWKMITDLKNNQNILLSSSLDHRINIWNLESLQHIYQYNTNEEIFQIDIIHENLFYYRTLQNIVIFKLNLHTLLFSMTKSKVLALKLFTDIQKIARVTVILEDYSCILISPVSGCCLTYVPNTAKKPIKQILHDISRSSIYSLQFNGEIILYHTYNNPCVAQYKIQTKSEQYAITCMTLINPMRTHLFSLNATQISTEKSLGKQAIFFGHANGYISLFQGDSLIMEPILAHKNSIVCLETSRASMDTSNISFTNSEVLLSCGTDRIIYIWDLTINKSDESIQLIHIITIEQEKNISFEPIKFLSMIDNFLVANYSDQNFLHIWQLLNISLQTNTYNQWGIVEHPTKGSYHHGQIQAISATSKLKLFASSDTEGSIKIWDNTNSLLREIYLDKTLGAIEFLSLNGELIIAYQNNIHLILPENYLINDKKFKTKQEVIMHSIAEDIRLEINQPLIIPYQSLPIFNYNIKTHHIKKRLERFERQLSGRYAVIESDSSQSDNEDLQSSNTDRLSIISDDPNWSELAEDVKDILRMKKYEVRHQHK